MKVVCAECMKMCCLGGKNSVVKGLILVNLIWQFFPAPPNRQITPPPAKFSRYTAFTSAILYKYHHSTKLYKISRVCCRTSIVTSAKHE